jgi:DNA-binding GntR family transcriptional regulator
LYTSSLVAARQVFEKRFMENFSEAPLQPAAGGNAWATLAEQAYGILIDEIVSLEIPPGTLLSEWGLSKRLGLGRTPIREAIKQLIRDQLVTLVPRRGILTTEISVSDMLLMLEPRRALEPLRYARAAAGASPEEKLKFHDLAEKLDSVASTFDVRAHSAVDREFDELVDRCAANPYLTNALTPLHNHVRRYWNAQTVNGGFTGIAKLHARLVRAVGSGVPRDAAAACRDMLGFNEEFLRVRMTHAGKEH